MAKTQDTRKTVSGGNRKKDKDREHEEKNQKYNKKNRKNNDTKICQRYAKTKTCPFGTNCKFSHDVVPMGPGKQAWNQRASSPGEASEQQLAKTEYNIWKRMVRVQPKANDHTIISFWRGALNILEGSDRECKQMLARDLDNEDYYGRAHISTILNMSLPSDDCLRLIKLTQPFFLVITNSFILSCLSIDTCVGGIYNYISGTNGTRAASFLKRLCETLSASMTRNLTSTSELSIERTITAMSTALFELLKREQRARFNEEFTDIIGLLRVITKRFATDANEVTLQAVLRRIEQVQAMISRAQGLLAEDAQIDSSVNAVPPLPHMYPRGVSKPQDRHDNDKADITQIKIYPTREEILSNDVEFLPSTDPDMPHFLTNSAERHIDTYFRLLRHDIFGELKDGLASLMQNLQENSSLWDKQKFRIGDMRLHTYPNAFVSYVSFDGRRGLEAQISFSQITSICSKSAFEKRKWWEESRRLSEGVLLSFITVNESGPSYLFLKVSERCTDTKRDRSLVKDNNQATIVAQLTTDDIIDTKLLISLSYQKTRGVLVEFPSIIPATFVPILENLQNMQRQSRLPFQQWIIPERPKMSSARRHLLVPPPPLYARRPNFKFSLKSILKDNDGDLTVTPTCFTKDDVVLENMSGQTGLDIGQCKALVAALSREYAFIQGPPGTGKSYLGIKLMKVLLECKHTGGLGPIVVMYVALP
jgi:hypothetical protein